VNNYREGKMKKNLIKEWKV